jgi:hypothetical protein
MDEQPKAEGRSGAVAHISGKAVRSGGYPGDGGLIRFDHAAGRQSCHLISGGAFAKDNRQVHRQITRTVPAEWPASATMTLYDLGFQNGAAAMATPCLT